MKKEKLIAEGGCNESGLFYEAQLPHRFLPRFWRTILPIDPTDMQKTE